MSGYPPAPSGGGYPPAPSGGGYPPAPSGGGFGAPPMGGWGAPPPMGGGYPPAPSGGWGAPPPMGGGFGAPPPMGGWGAPPPMGGGYPPAPSGGWGAPPMGGGFGAPPPMGAPGPERGGLGFGVPPSGGGFAPPQQGFGPPQPYGAPPQSGFGAPSPSGYGGSTTVQVTTVTTVHQGGSGLRFFNNMNNHLQKDYILIVDKSGSMAGSNWEQAEKAVAALAPNITRCDPDGITLYFFSSKGSYPKLTNIKDPRQVTEAFRDHRPGGTTCLDGVLSVAFDEHFRKGGQTTILVVTDGEPDDRRAVERVIRDAANRLNRDEDLSVSFIQIGHDHSATRFLQKLDDDLRGCKFDIVDAETADRMQGMDFAEFINKSIRD